MQSKSQKDTNAGTANTKERPILFSERMVWEILNGCKTVTRRVMKPQPPMETDYIVSGEHEKANKYLAISTDESGEFMATLDPYLKCKYGNIGDLLWVRETWQYYDWTEEGKPFIRFAADHSVELMDCAEEWEERVRSIWAELSMPDNFKFHKRACDRGWRPSIFMPRWASRISLGITGITAERLDNITEEEAKEEGCGSRAEFVEIWKKINGVESWDANPWVWAVSFQVVKGADCNPNETGKVVG